MFSSLQMPTRPQCRRAEPNGSHRSFSSISSESQRHRLRRPGWVVKKRPNASEDRRACGRGPCGGPRGSAPCPPADWRTRPSGGAAGGERRPGRRHREVPPGPRGCGRTPGLARCNLVPAATSRCHVRRARAPSRCLPRGDRSSPLRRQQELAGRHLGHARTSRRQSGRAGGHAHLSPTSAAFPRRAPWTRPRAGPARRPRVTPDVA